MEKFVCIHGHFYQPPRENPWLEEVELQDSAYPYHDWNERITAECYGPNASSRILDGDGRIVNIVNNYSSVSFNFGPTLLSWLEEKQPKIYAAILEADKISREKFSGHGAALAQVYNHMILPLANERDGITQVLWGIADFRQRFGRRPEGMWLPETAADINSLEVLAEQEIQFTILSPYQAGRVRIIGDEQWRDARGGKIDPSTPYLHRLPSGRSITIFFYDGPVSRAVAFEKLLEKGETFANRLLGVFNGERPWPQLVHIATDGESYGHHHTHGDMGLAYALHEIEKNPGVKLTNYGEFLEKHPPTHEVEIVENTSWSCVHGVERWRSNCGCNSGRAGWHQEWRAPLREALDWLRDSVAPQFEEHARKLFLNPGQARDEYIQVILDRSPDNVAKFLRGQMGRETLDSERVTALKLMELQRQAMLMYTSCGWFFDDISGIETVQIIAYAGRLIQLAEELFDENLEEPFLERLSRAKSNVAEHADGRIIYEKWIRPSVVGWNRVTAHYAVSSLFEDYSDETGVFCYTARRSDFHCLTAGKAKMLIGRAEVTSEVTRESQELSFGVMHFGDHIVNGGVRRFEKEEDYQELLTDASEAFERADFPQVLRLFDRSFGETSYSLKSLFRDEQRKVVDQLLDIHRSEAEAVYRRLYEDNLPTMRFLADLNIPLPGPMRTATEFIIRTDLHAAFRQDEPDLEPIYDLLDEAKRWGVALDTQGLAYQFTVTLSKAAKQLQKKPTDLDSLVQLEQLVELALTLPFEVDLWETQNVYFQLVQTVYSDLVGGQAWLDHFQNLGDKLGVQVQRLKKKIAELRNSPSLASVLDDLFANPKIPTATYRLQFNDRFTFREAREAATYLRDLGISDCYASPLLHAHPESAHGYDICDHDRLSDALGGQQEFDRFADTLHEFGMGLVLDTVPNHMSIAHADNHCWQDVLENGPSSQYANYFDIDWQPANPNLQDKVLLPVLGEQYGTALESGRIQLHFKSGAFYLTYYEHHFPVSPCTYSRILEHNLDRLSAKLGDEDADVLELKSVLTALKHLPARTTSNPEQIDERAREKEIVKRRLEELADSCGDIREHIAAAVRDFNGQAGDPASFDLLDRLLDEQAFRPAYWRVATEEINYRRFFDVNDLAAIRVEAPAVFDGAHRLFLDLLADGKATGLRIDHPDGLWNPSGYFNHLQETFVCRRAQKRIKQKQETETVAAEVSKRFSEQINGKPGPNWPLFVVAEKILVGDEPLPRDWAVYGTTGYDALNTINGLFVDRAAEQAFSDIYARFIKDGNDFASTVASCKRMIMLVSLASEINSLAHRLDRISERNRCYRDFTLNSLTFAIREIIASLEVYRTYITGPRDIAPRDRKYIEEAVAEAKRHNPRTAAAVFDFVRDTILLQNLDDFHDTDRPEIVELAMKFQQITGPVMAKGAEDTAFYIYNRLVSLNEVGGSPEKFGVSPEEFHRANMERSRFWPNAMIATSTHDTKRSEDVRARLNVLSEMPAAWEAAIVRWNQINGGQKTQLDKIAAPSLNDEYLLYQALLGAWPAEGIAPEQMGCFRKRICEYMQKATREAKVHTSWINPNDAYDAAVWTFVERLLPDNPEQEFLQDFLPFQERIAFFGYVNSLAQTLFKLTIPGVPDVYQGTELWDFSLVDPDNRRPVDFNKRRSLLGDLRNRIKKDESDLVPLCKELREDITDGRMKMYLIHRILSWRGGQKLLFDRGDYSPVEALGPKQRHICAFMRTFEEKRILVAAPRLVFGLNDGEKVLPLGSDIWQDTVIVLPQGNSECKLRNLFTQEMIDVSERDGKPVLAAAQSFAHFPVFVGDLIDS